MKKGKLETTVRYGVIGAIAITLVICVASLIMQGHDGLLMTLLGAIGVGVAGWISPQPEKLAERFKKLFNK